MKRQTDMLPVVHNWFLAQASAYVARNVQLEIVGMSSDTQKDALSVRFSTPVGEMQLSDIAGSMQLWDTGECDVQVLDMRSGDLLLNVTFEFADAQHIIRAVSAVLDILSRPTQGIDRSHFESAWTRSLHD